MRLADSSTFSPFAFTRRQALGAIAVAAALPTGTFAQSDRPVRLIVNTTAGSGVDGTARAVQPALGRALGVPLVVENHAGAGGLIGLQTVARAAPDGTTIAFATNNLAIFPSVLKSVPFDVLKDFTPIAMLGDIPLVLVVNPAKVAATNAKDFIALLKAKPDALNYGSSGSGTVLHLATELFLEEVSAKIKHIPYKGVAPMMTDLIGGQVDFVVAALPVAQPYIKSGALRAIGICTARRVPIAPEIPTFVEQGLPNYVMEAWVSVLGPKGMAPAAVKKVHEAVVVAFNDAAVREAMAKQGTVINITTPEQAQATIRRDVAKYGALVKKIDLQPQ